MADKKVIYKLRMDGISPSILRWIELEAFLTGRKQQVCVNGPYVQIINGLMSLVVYHKEVFLVQYYCYYLYK